MASVVQNKRTSESKFVSICADGSDGSPDVDISFKEPLLSRPSDHYMVGVDNLTVNMNHFAMMRLSEGPDDFVLRIGRLSNGNAGNNVFNPVGVAPAAQILAGVGEPTGQVFQNALEPFVIEQNYQTFNQFVLALNEYFSFINRHTLSITLANGILADGYNIIQPGVPVLGVIPNQAQLDSEAPVQHISMNIGADGKLRLTGTRAFWANYCVYIPKMEYQFMIMGKKMEYPYITLDGEGKSFSPIEAHSDLLVLYKPINAATNDAYTAAEQQQISAAVGDADLAYRNTAFILQFGANLLSSTDRRIALEIGTSLPIVNNPMVDHNQEHPDFTIGRWMWNPRAQMDTMSTGIDLRYTVLAPSVHEFQNSTDRVQYHSLMPQDKIVFLRLKMYCRVRLFNETRERYDMDTQVMPMTLNDWWHCRLHFVSKD